VRIQPDDRALTDYYAALDAAHKQGAEHEGNVRNAFERLLEVTAKGNNWTLVSEHSDTALTGRGIRYDGVLRDEFRLPHGWWEAKDSADDLNAEIRRKIDKGYSVKNTVFEDTRSAVLYQDGREAARTSLRDRDGLANLLSLFYSHTIAPFDNFDDAVKHFAGEIPHVAKALNERIQAAHKDNKKFQKAFDAFFELCKSALNPNLRRDAVDEMLIQHMLTERLIVRVFDVEHFAASNVIAHEIQTVITALTSKHFNYKAFLGSLDRFYDAIESAADSLATFSEKQAFLDNVYERFFQGYAVKVADTHGIVYTPQPIVDFMCAAVEEVLRDEFGLALGDPGVTVIDPATGTGNFVVNLLRRVPPQNLKRAYREQFFANEVMLLPYYIASLNIEHAYMELTGEYEPFEGICFVDTLDLAEGPQLRFDFMSEGNSERVARQKATEMMVIIGNPPYNVGQLNENDNNKNRKYDVIDKRVAATYVKDSTATLRMQLYDAYVKFFRWATDRLGNRDGIVCYVTNNSFVDQIAFDGMRKHLLEDFTRVYHLDLHGNVRQNPKLSGTTHNVFGIQVGVGITVAIRSSKHTERELFYRRVPEFWTKKEKLAFLDENVERDGKKNSLNTIEWKPIVPSETYNWLQLKNADEFQNHITLGSKETKAKRGSHVEAVFRTYSRGISTNADDYVYDFSTEVLATKAKNIVDDYRSQLARWLIEGRPNDVSAFLKVDEGVHKWIRNTKRTLLRGSQVSYDVDSIRLALYRPFTKRYHFFDRAFNEDIYQFPRIFPTPVAELENRVIAVTDLGSAKPFMTLISDRISDLHLVGAGASCQCFPFYVYDEDGGNRQENITNWALAQFQQQYGDGNIGKWDIFYYVYGLLHHPGYREKYADSLKRELPRIPFASDFWAFADAGLKLAELHLYYDTERIVTPYPLEYVWAEGKRPNWRVEKMRLSKDGTELVINDTLTLAGIPPETYDYKLGNRSALEWVIDQYRVKADKRSGIVSDPNRADDEQYIVNLVRQVVAVSVETVALVAALPAFE
jgi:predicted helicase